MRKGLIAAAFTAAAAFVTPASATIVTTTGTSCTGSVCFLPAKLQIFDNDLGFLENIVVHVEVDSETAYIDDFLSYDSYPAIQSGTAHLSYTGPFQFTLNGLTYSLDISGEEDLSRTAALLGVAYGGGTFHATGSQTFVIDQSLFSLFTNPSSICGGTIGTLCATGSMPPSIQTVVQTSDNLRFRDFDAAAFSRFTLSYVYRPVPEPTSWAMMLLGFGAIGLAMRSRRQRFPKPLGGAAV